MEKKTMKKIFKKKKRTGRSKNPGAWSLELGAWSLELGAYTGRSFDISYKATNTFDLAGEGGGDFLD